MRIHFDCPLLSSCVCGVNSAFVVEPDEVVGMLRHVPYHLQEVDRILSNRLTKGQALGTHMEPTEKTYRGPTETGSAASDVYILKKKAPQLVCS